MSLVVDINWLFFAAACVFVALDVLTGLWQSIVNNCFSSQKMRTGLGHKITLVIWCGVGALADIACATLATDAIGAGVPVFESVCIYIIVMELGSVCENLSKAYPEAGVAKFFGGVDNGNED